MTAQVVTALASVMSDTGALSRELSALRNVPLGVLDLLAPSSMAAAAVPPVSGEKIVVSNALEDGSMLAMDVEPVLMGWKVTELVHVSHHGLVSLVMSALRKSTSTGVSSLLSVSRLDPSSSSVVLEVMPTSTRRLRVARPSSSPFSLSWAFLLQPVESASLDLPRVDPSPEAVEQPLPQAASPQPLQARDLPCSLVSPSPLVVSPVTQWFKFLMT